jgi:hypothetical protein
MKRTIAFASFVLAASCALGCGGVSLNGGQSGTGIAAIRGTVVTVTGAAPDVTNIQVSVAATNLTTHTDASGRFELRGKLSGPAELLFARQRDGLSASASIVIPAGGVLDLEEIVLDAESGEAHPGRQVVEFDGAVTALDCSGGAIRVEPTGDDFTATVFTIDAASATIRRGGVGLTCNDLQVGDRAQIRGETADGATLVNAIVVLEDGQPARTPTARETPTDDRSLGGAPPTPPRDEAR